MADQLIENLKNEVPQVDVIIINEQVLSGIHTNYFKPKLVELIQQFPKKIFIVDSRNYNNFYDGAYRKMNDIEAANLCGIKKDSTDIVLYSEVKKAAQILFKRYKKPLFITRGDRGSLIVDKNGITDISGLLIIAKIDSVEAGDSYLAGAAATLEAGYNMELAAEIGTYVAGVTVQKLFQTGTTTPEEILQIGSDPDFVYRPELAEDNFIEDSEIERINI